MAPSAPVSAEQLLRNGDFESGSSSWTGIGFSTSSACARSGSAGLLLSTTNDDKSARGRQTLTPASPGTYILRAYVRLQPGTTGSVSASLSVRATYASGPI